MLSPVSRRLLGPRLPRMPPPRTSVTRARMPRLCRAISQVPLNPTAVYTAFPATLHYYSPHRVSSLFDCREKPSRPDDLLDETVYVADNGLVYPCVEKPSRYNPLFTVSGGAVFMPNTPVIQEFARIYFDQAYLDLLDKGKQVEEPYIYTVAKGTPVPSHLSLIHDSKEWFSLQPSDQGLTLNNLNRSLDAFYDEHALKEPARKWLAEHSLFDSIANAEEHVWMAK